MIYLAQTDTTVGFLSKNLKELNIAKGRKLDQDCLITISKFSLLKDFVRVPVNFRNFVRRAKKTTIIYPNLKSFRVVKDCEHAKFLDKNGWFYSTSANKHGFKFDFKFAKKVANKIVFNDDGSKFVEGEASRIYRISKIKKKEVEMIEVMQNLKNNGFEVVLVEDKNEALEYAKKFIKADISIGLGGSTTVAEIGLLDYLTSLKNIILFNQYEKNISGAENLKRRRDGLLSDLYITGTNAITKNGELVNVDGSGNRVAAQIFGPKKVLIFVSTDKIVNNLEEAMDRINKICIPKNIQRCNETALKYGKEPKFNKKNIAKKFSIIKGDDEGRIIIVLIKQRLGF